MRFKQYLKEASSDFITDKQDVQEWLDKNGISNDRVYGMTYRNIDSDGEVSIVANGHDIAFTENTILVGKNHLPIQFNDIRAHAVEMMSMSITSLKGLPKVLDARLELTDLLNLTSLEGLPSSITHLKIVRCRLNFEGISDILQNINSHHLEMYGCEVVSGGIGLIFVKGLTRITGHQPAFGIIERYLGRPDDIFECQNELIEAGYEAYARL